MYQYDVNISAANNVCFLFIEMERDHCGQVKRRDGTTTKLNIYALSIISQEAQLRVTMSYRSFSIPETTHYWIYL